MYEPSGRWPRRSTSRSAFTRDRPTRCRTVGVDRFEDDRAARHMISHTMEMMLAALSVIWGGVVDRHPRLRVAFLESGGGWIAPWLDRMDRHFDDQGFNESAPKTRPTEFFQRNCWISFEPVEQHRGARRLHRSLEVREEDRDLFALAFQGGLGGEDLLGQMPGRVASPGRANEPRPAVPAATAWPHRRQKRAPAGSSAPKDPQASARRSSHPRQNLAWVGLTCWHQGHFTAAGAPIGDARSMRRRHPRDRALSPFPPSRLFQGRERRR